MEARLGGAGGGFVCRNFGLSDLPRREGFKLDSMQGDPGLLRIVSSTNHEIVIEADTRLIVAVGRPVPENATTVRRGSCPARRRSAGGQRERLGRRGFGLPGQRTQRSASASSGGSRPAPMSAARPACSAPIR